jgi:toxin YoeB
VSKGWRVVYTAQAQKDARRLARSGLRARAEKLLDLLARDPLETPLSFEKLLGDLAGAYSRRINIQRRLVYQVLEKDRVVKALRLVSHGQNAFPEIPSANTNLVTDGRGRLATRALDVPDRRLKRSAGGRGLPATSRSRA